MDELFNILSSSARIDKSKRNKRKSPSTTTNTNTIPPPEPEPNPNSNEDESSNPKNHPPSKLNQIHRERINAFRNKLRINLSKSNRHDPTVEDPISSFDDLGVPSWWSHGGGGEVAFRSLKNVIVRNVEEGRWINPTPIQMQAIPSILGRRDVLGCAPTGSGKSGAFIIPTLFLSSVDDDIFYRRGGDDVSTEEGESKGSTNTKKKKKKSKGGHDDDETGSGARDASRGKIRALFLAPSRELASQLHREVERLGVGKYRGLKSALLSKANAASICASSSGDARSGGGGSGKGLDVLISTPLRLVECLTKERETGKKLDLGSVRIVVLDEADRLLDASDGTTDTNKSSSSNNNQQSQQQQQQQQSGNAHVKTFLSQIDTILANVPPSAIRALFSATVGSSVRHLSESILRNQIDISINSKSGNDSNASGVNDDISQSLQFVGREEGKLLAIRQMMAKGMDPPVIIFLQSKERAQALYMELMYDSRMRVDVIHAGRSQRARDLAVERFRKGETWVLICTDLCARGLDFKAVNMVINYDLPTSGVTYVHRIGRCGRAGRKGVAITYFTEADFDNLRNIANVMKLSGCDVPEWMLSLKRGSGGGGGGGQKQGHNGGRSRNNNNRKNIPMKRKTIDTTPRRRHK